LDWQNISHTSILGKVSTSATALKRMCGATKETYSSTSKGLSISIALVRRY